MHGPGTTVKGSVLARGVSLFSLFSNMTLFSGWEREVLTSAAFCVIDTFRQLLEMEKTQFHTIRSLRARSRTLVTWNDI